MQKNICYNTFIFYQYCIIIELGWIARVAIMVFGEGGAVTQNVVRDLSMNSYIYFMFRQNTSFIVLDPVTLLWAGIYIECFEAIIEK